MQAECKKQLKEVIMTEHDGLIESVIKELKPQYTTMLKKDTNADTAYEKLYPKVLRLVAKDLKISEAKTEFEARQILQKIIQEITR